MKTSPFHVWSFTIAPPRRLADVRGLALLVLIVAALFGNSAMAATATWTGAASGNWADANWSGGSGGGGAPGTSGNSLVFTSATGAGGTSLTDNLMTPSACTLNGITFNSGAAAFVINSGTAGVNGFTLAGGITNAGASLETINDVITLPSVETFTTASGGGNITIGGNVNGAGGITKAGLGVLTLSGNNAFGGGTIVNAGTLALGVSNSLLTTGTLTVQGSGTFDLAGNSQTVGSLSDGGVSTGIITSSVAASTLTIDNSSPNTFSGAIADNNALNGASLALALSGGSTVTLSGSNTYTGTTAINAGTLTLSSIGSIGTAATPSGAIMVTGPAAFNVSGGSVYASSLSTTNFGGTPTVNLTAGGSINLSGALNVNNGGAFNGLVSLASGTLTANSVTISRGGGNEGPDPVLFGSTADGLYVNGGTLNDATNLTLAGSNSSANMRIDSGSVIVGGTTVITDLGNNRISVLDINGGTFTSNAATGLGIQIGGDASSVGDGAGELLLRNSGVLNTTTITLGDATETGASLNVFEATGGTANIGSGGIVTGIPAGSTATNIVALGGSNSFPALTIVATASWSSSLPMTLTNDAIGQAPIFQTANGKNISLSGDLAGSGGLTKTGAGILTLSGADSYTGGTTVSAGTLAMGAANSLLSTGTLTIEGTGIFDLAGNSQPVGGLSDGGVSTGVITSSTGGPTLTVNNSSPNTFSGAITDNNAVNGASLALALRGNSSVALSGSNNFTGGTFLVSGNLTVASDYALGSSTTSNLNAGLNFDQTSGTVTAYFTSANPNIASLSTLSASGTGNVVLGNTSGSGSATTLYVGAGGESAYGPDGSTFAGTISDLTASNANAVGNLVVDAGGLLILAGVDTFTGTTVISGSNADLEFSSELQIQNSLALQNTTLNYNNQGGTVSFGSLLKATLGGLTGSQTLALVNAGVEPVTLTIGNNNVSSAYTGSLNGPGGLTKVGSGTVQIGSGKAGGAAYTGNTIVSQGSLIIGGTSNLTGTLDLEGYIGTTSEANSLVVQDDAVIDSSGDLDLSSNDGGNSGNSPGVSTALVTGTASVTVRGLSIGDVSRVPTGDSVTVNDNASLTVNGVFDLLDTEGGLPSATTINLNGGTLAANSFALIQGSNPSAQLVNFDFNGGVLMAGASDASPFTSGTGDFMGPNTGISGPEFGIEGGLTLNVETGGAIINTNGFSITIAQNLVHGGGSPDGGLTKTGAGTLTLSGANTYTGATTVNAGTAIVTGSLPDTASASVAGGAHLEVDGLLNNGAGATVAGQFSGAGSVGAVTVVPGGTLSPGLSSTDPGFTGILDAGNNVSLENGSTFSIRLGLQTGADSDTDELVMNGGTFSLDNTILQILPGAAENNFGLLGNTYVIVSGGAGEATGIGTNTDVFAGVPASGDNLTVNGYVFNVIYATNSAGSGYGTGSDVVLKLKVIPEPNTWKIVISGFAMLIGIRRWRRRSPESD